MKKLVGFVFLGSMLAISVASAQGTEAQRLACEEDAFKWCPYDIPDPQKIQVCLQKNLRFLSAGCQAQFGYQAKRR